MSAARSGGAADDRGRPLGSCDSRETANVARLNWRGRSPDGEDRALLSRYLKEISRLPALNPVEEQALAQLVAEGNEEARRRLVEANLERVLKTAKRYLRRGLPIMELVEEGNIGLLNAVTHYRPQSGTKFSMYASWWIRQAISQALTSHVRSTRMPGYTAALFRQYLNAQAGLGGALGRPATLREIAEHLGAAIEDLVPFENITIDATRYNTPPSKECVFDPYQRPRSSVG